MLLPQVSRRVAVEAGRPEMWYKYVGMNGLVHGIDHFGESAPAGAGKKIWLYRKAICRKNYKALLR